MGISIHNKRSKKFLTQALINRQGQTQKLHPPRHPNQLIQTVPKPSYFQKVDIHVFGLDDSPTSNRVISSNVLTIAKE